MCVGESASVNVHVCEGELSERAVWGEREQNLISTKLIIPETKSVLSENSHCHCHADMDTPPSAFLSLVVRYGALSPHVFIKSAHVFFVELLNLSTDHCTPH
jgi:hypothetical protein